MRTAEIPFPDDARIDARLRGRTLAVGYEIMVSEGGPIISDVYVDEQEVRGYAAEFALDYS